MSHPLFGPEVRGMLAEGDPVALRAFCENLHPSVVARTLSPDSFTVDEVWRVLELSEILQQATIFEYMPPSWQVELAAGTGHAHMARLIEQMSHDDRVALLRRLAPSVSESLLRLVDDADRRDIANLSKYGETTVGSLMTTDYAWLPENLTAHQALERIRQQAPDRETIYYIYILSDPGRKLLGMVSLKDLVLANPNTPLMQLMNDELQTLKAQDDRKEAASRLARFDFLAMPVTDDDDRLVGIVTHDDMLDVIQEAATSDIQRQAGVQPLGEGYLETPFVSLWRNRTLWLSMLFIAEMLTFNALEHFDKALEQVDILKYFIPLVLATGGNSGTQAASLITRALALGQITLNMWARVLRHEIVIGLAISISLGAIAILRSLLVSNDKLAGVDPWMFSIVLALGVSCVCLFGTLVGAMLPLIFKRLGADPALASSPFVSTFVDVSGIIIFFNIAQWLLL